MASTLSTLPLDRLRQLLGTRGWPRALALRRLVAGGLVLLAAVLAVRPEPAGDASTGPMLVAARDLAPGVSLGPADLRVVAAPEVLRPAGALGAVEEAIGRILASAASAGEPITGARLVGPENTRLATGGRDAVAVPVRLADPGVAELLTPGVRVDVVTVDARGTAGTLLAAEATVLTVRDEENEAAGNGRLVVIAVPRDSATRVASVSLGQPVTITLH